MTFKRERERKMNSSRNKTVMETGKEKVRSKKNVSKEENDSSTVSYLKKMQAISGWREREEQNRMIFNH